MEPAAAAHPTGHAVQFRPEPKVAVPPGHGTQKLDPNMGATDPAGQVVHAVLPTPLCDFENEPAGQDAQAHDPEVAENVPSGHCFTLVRSLGDTYFPAGAMLHDVAPVFPAQLPKAQRVQFV